MNLNYKSFGAGFPVIILHGLFGSLDNWQTIAKKLAENYLVYIIDLRNHGRSPHQEEFDYPIMADDLQAFMESQWIYEAHIIGHSMGGKVAMQFAINYPELVRHLVVVDIAPKVYKESHLFIFDALFSLDLAKINHRKEADEYLKTKIPSFGVRQFLLKNLSRKKDGQFEWKMNLPIIFTNYQKILGNIEGTDTFENLSLFIKGGQSDYVQANDLEIIQAFFPNAEIKTIEKAGHWIHADAGVELLGELEAFFERR